MKTVIPKIITAAAALLLASPAAVLNSNAAWTPPQGSVPAPTVVTVDSLPWAVAPAGPDGTLPANTPMGQLVLGPDGALYGATVQGGSLGTSAYPWGNGTLFKLQPDGSFTQLHVFDGSDGSCLGADLTSPTLNVPPLVVGPDGALYGCTIQGGDWGGGTLFRLETDGTFMKIHDFGAEVGDGNLPDTGLVAGPDGALYGTTSYGGQFGNGAVFRFELSGAYTVLHSFSYEDGGLFNITYDGAFCPDSALVFGPDGALYGSTPSGGGPGGQGTVFKLQLDGTFTKLHDFTDSEGGKSALIVGQDGALYGSSSQALFRMTTNGMFTQLYGLGPESASGSPAMTLGTDGALYGSADSTLYRLETSGAVTVLHIGAPVTAPLVVGPDGAMYGASPTGGASASATIFKLETNGTFTTLYEFSFADGVRPGALVVGPDGALYGSAQAGGPGGGGSLFKLVLPSTRPLVETLNPARATAGSGDVSVTINGIGFVSGARVFFDSTEVPVTYLSTTQLQVVVSASALPSPADFATMQVTVLNPGGALSRPAGFTVIAAALSGTVSGVQSSVAAPGETATVRSTPTDSTSAGVSASLQNSSGTASAAVTAATYTQNPTPTPAFEAGGGFVDLQVSGATPQDQLTSSFYYPQAVIGAAETALALKFFDGTQWIMVLSSGGIPPTKNTADNLDGTVSGGRFQVVFDDTSTPRLTALNGTVFAVAVPDATPPTISCPTVAVPCNVALQVPVTYPSATVSDNVDPYPRVTYSIPSGSGFPVGTTAVTGIATDAAGNHAATTFTVTRAPLQFTGFLSPIGGADSSGGSYASPLRTFKAGSTIPVKFIAQCGGAAVTTGIHRLQAVKYTSATTAGTPIDATPQDAATTGDQFRLTSGQWQFNLDTKSTGMTTGIWLLLATLSDGSQHSVWVQLK